MVVGNRTWCVDPIRTCCWTHSNSSDRRTEGFSRLHKTPTPARSCKSDLQKRKEKRTRLQEATQLTFQLIFSSTGPVATNQNAKFHCTIVISFFISNSKSRFQNTTFWFPYFSLLDSLSRSPLRLFCAGRWFGDFQLGVSFERDRTCWTNSWSSCRSRDTETWATCRTETSGGPANRTFSCNFADTFHTGTLFVATRLANLQTVAKLPRNHTWDRRAPDNTRDLKSKDPTIERMNKWVLWAGFVFRFRFSNGTYIQGNK